MSEQPIPTDRALATQHAQNYGLVPAEQLAQMQDLADRFFKSGLAPSKFENPQQIIITALFGRELGMSFQQSLTAVHVIEGVPSLHYKDQLGLIRARCPEAKIKFLQADVEGCVIEAWRPGEEIPTKFSFTRADAQRAGLLALRNGEIIKDNWRNYPEDMMIGRAVGRMSRRLFSDVMRGFGYTPEEIMDAPKLNVAPAQPRATVSAEATVIPKKAKAAEPKPEIEEAQVVNEAAKLEAAPEAPSEEPEAIDRDAVLTLVEALNLAENSNTMDFIYSKWREDNANKEATLVQGYMVYTKAQANKRLSESASDSKS